MRDLTVSEAAARLQISEPRVRGLISHGVLDAHKFAGRWAIDPDSVSALEAARRRRGQPMSPRMSWGLIALLEGREPIGLSGPERSRLRARIKARPEIAEVAPLLRKRCSVKRLRAHPGVLRRALEHPEAVATGASASGHDVLALDLVEIYLPDTVASKAIRSLRAHPAARRNVNMIVRVPSGPWPFVGVQAGPATVALDLWDALDSRSRRTAVRMWERLLDGSDVVAK